MKYLILIIGLFVCSVESIRAMDAVLVTVPQSKCLICSDQVSNVVQSFEFKQFACDECCDAGDRDTCSLCSQALEIGSAICKISLTHEESYSHPYYFHNKCLREYSDNKVCKQCITRFVHHIDRSIKIKEIQDCAINSGFNCLKIGAAVVAMAAFFLILWYFSMGPGSDSYCPCNQILHSSEEASCDSSQYPGCSVRFGNRN
jgi:hypothetical protein